MLNQLIRAGHAFAALALLSIVLGCGSGAEKVAESALETMIEKAGAADGVEVDVDFRGNGESFSIKTKEGEFSMTVGGGAKIPDDFPKDIPTYPKATVTITQSMEGQGFMIQATTGDSMEKVVGYLENEAAKAGWEQTMSLNQNIGQPMKMLNFAKGDRVANYTIIRQTDETIISITSAEK